MNTRASSLKPGATRKRGFTLIECLVYIGAVMVVLGVGTFAFWKCWDANKAIRRNADDIVRALHAGERWRAEVRAAVGPIQSENTGGVERLRIPGPKGEIVYAFTNGELHRQAAPGAPDVVVLTKIKSSRMQPDPRQHVTAWRWELELEQAQKKARLRPLFTFETVPGNLAAR